MPVFLIKKIHRHVVHCKAVFKREFGLVIQRSKKKMGIRYENMDQWHIRPLYFTFILFSFVLLLYILALSFLVI
jgi:hypothetical protein